MGSKANREDLSGYTRFANVLLPDRVAHEIGAERAAKREIEDASMFDVGAEDPFEKNRREREAASAEAKKATEEAAIAASEAALRASLPAWALAKRRVKPAFAHVLYDPSRLPASAAVAAFSTVKDDKERKRLGVMHDFWRALGGMRLLAEPVKRWPKYLDDLEADMPNFGQVITYLRGELALAKLARRPVQLAPLLLDGPPGVGKTTFARKIAALFGSGFMSVSMETAQTAAALSGSEEYWGNSKPGQLFSLLVEGEFANPVVLIDEVDKVRSAGNYDPASALYGLLEPSSAATWHDLSVPHMKINASRVMWILTSNDKARVAQPLLSRMRCFDVAALTAEQSHAAARRIFAEIVKELKVGFSPTLPDAVAKALAEGSPREMHRIARELVARAALAGRRQVTAEDAASIPATVKPAPVTSTTRVSMVMDIETPKASDKSADTEAAEVELVSNKPKKILH